MFHTRIDNVKNCLELIPNVFRVFSFKYTKLQLDNKIFLQDEYSWIDFSFGSKKVCFHTSASNQVLNI